MRDVIGLLPGTLIRLVLTFALLISRLDHPHVGILGLSSDGSEFADVAVHPDYAEVTEALIYRFEAPLLFTNADIFATDIQDRLKFGRPSGSVWDQDTASSNLARPTSSAFELDDQRDPADRFV